MLLASVGVMLSGCSQSGSQATRRPGLDWPTPQGPQSGTGQTVHHPPTYPQRPAPTQPAPATGSMPALLGAHGRTQWASAGPITGRVNPMNGVNRITLHHEGWTSVWFTDQPTTRQRIEQIRTVHTRDRGWGDIGYHFIVDRAGEVWEARDVRYQGAHVGGNNEHNIGVVALGNFDNQTPSHAQLSSLVRVVQTLQRHYRVPAHRVYTHQELSPSACPGRNLQPRIAAMRNSGTFA